MVSGYYSDYQKETLRNREESNRLLQDQNARL